MSRSCGWTASLAHRRNNVRCLAMLRTVPVNPGWLPSRNRWVGLVRMSLRRLAQPKKRRST